MFSRFNKYLFAGFVFSLKSSVVIALLYTLLGAVTTYLVSFRSQPEADFNFFLMVLPMVFIYCFPIVLFFFYLWMLIRHKMILKNVQREAYLVSILSAFVTNLGLVIPLGRNAKLMISFYLFNFLISVLAVFVTSRFYLTTWNKLTRLIEEAEE